MEMLILFQNIKDTPYETSDVLLIIQSITHANDLTLLTQAIIFSTTTGCVFQRGCLRNEKLLIATVGVK